MIVADLRNPRRSKIQCQAGEYIDHRDIFLERDFIQKQNLRKIRQELFLQQVFKSFGNSKFSLKKIMQRDLRNPTQLGGEWISER